MTHTHKPTRGTTRYSKDNERVDKPTGSKESYREGVNGIERRGGGGARQCSSETREKCHRWRIMKWLASLDNDHLYYNLFLSFLPLSSLLPPSTSFQLHQGVKNICKHALKAFSSKPPPFALTTTGETTHGQPPR